MPAETLVQAGILKARRMEIDEPDNLSACGGAVCFCRHLTFLLPDCQRKVLFLPYQTIKI